MTEALNRVIEFAFTDLNLRRINIFAATENIASNATIKKVGFVFEGMAKKAMRSRANNLFFDKNMYGMLKEDYLKLSKEKLKGGIVKNPFF